jgi:hypothetical protein
MYQDPEEEQIQSAIDDLLAALRESRKADICEIRDVLRREPGHHLSVKSALAALSRLAGDE